MKKMTIAAALLLTALASPHPSIAQSSASGTAPAATDLPSGLRIIDDKIGTGDPAKSGQSVTVNYTGWLYQNGGKGAKFDSSVDRDQPFTFTLGAGQVIPGWDQGVAGMKPGGKRTLIIPPDLAYGEQGAGNGLIPPWATLIFEVELLQAQ